MAKFLITLLYWCIATLPALPFVIIYLAYRRILRIKLLTIQQVMRSREVWESYLNSFPLTTVLTDIQAKKSNTEKSDAIVAALFELYYQWESYAFGIALNVLIAIIVTASILSRQQLPLGLAPGLSLLAAKILPTVSFGFAGAYLWTLYDLIGRYRAIDLTPSAFQFSWLRLVVVCIVAPLIAAGAADGLRNAVAFGVGALPLPVIAQYFNDLLKRTNIVTSTNRPPAQAPTLQYLQGMTDDIIERMAEEKVNSAQALAYSDPIRLFFKTDNEWNVILDMIDQAFLFLYIGERLASIAPMGIRGCVDLSYLFQRRLDAKNKDRAEEAKQAFEKLPDRLGMSHNEVVSLCRSLLDDGRVALLRRLVYQSSPTVEERAKMMSASTLSGD